VFARPENLDALEYPKVLRDKSRAPDPGTFSRSRRPEPALISSAVGIARPATEVDLLGLTSVAARLMGGGLFLSDLLTGHEHGYCWGADR
jgi:hypothetical protein